MEEDELAAIEEDVERKRVAKNPFEEKFTSLTETPFTEAVGSGQEEMETLSRQIIVRMEVIAKQIAFLSKETSGQPGKVLTGQAPPGGLVFAAAHDQHRPGGSDTNGSGDPNRSGAVHGDGVVVSGRSPLGAALSARFDLYRRICQGLVTAEELLPAEMISQSVQLLPATATSGDYPPHALESAATTDARPVPPPQQDLEGKGSNCESVRQDTRAPPGILHEFIKHVRPFSLCLDPSGPSSRMDQTPSETPFPDNQADAAEIAAIGGEIRPRREQGALPSLGRHAQDGEGGGGRYAPDGEGGGGRYARDRDGGRAMMTGGGGGGSVGAHGGLRGRDPSPPPASVLTGTGPSLGNSDTQQEVRSDRDGARASHTQEIYPTSALSLRRAKVRLNGKRKLPPPATTTMASTSGDLGATATAHPTATSAGKNGKKVSIKAEKSARRETKGVKSGGRAGLNTGGGDVSWSSLTWKSARTLRKRVEAAARTGNGQSSTAPPDKKGARGGGRKGAQTTMPDTVPGRPSAIGALGLVRANECLAFPKIERVSDYLISLANPARDVTAMKRLFRQEAPPPPAHIRHSTEPPGGSPSECAGSPESFNFEVNQMEREDDEVHSMPDKGGGQGTPAEESEVDRSRMPPSVGTPTLDAKPGLRTSLLSTRNTQPAGGTCTIDLRNNWQRAGAISNVISKAVEKRNSVASDLRESFSRLNVQQRERELEHQLASCDRGDEGRKKPSASEASMSVSLRYPPPGPRNDTQQPPPALPGGVEEKARMFALVMSLAHVHNTFAPTAAPAEAEGRGGGVTNVGQAASQLRVDLSSGGDEAIVVAVRKK